MLVIKTSEKKEAATFQHIIQGKAVSLTVKPWAEDEIEVLRKKNTSHEIVVHPETKQAARIESIDLEALGDDVLDHLLVGFSGIGKSATEPLPVTRGNKLLLGKLVPGTDEKSIYTAVREKAKELQAVIKLEEAEEIKNS